jgi:hypothetical protein
MTFSERIGKTPVKTIQFKSIDSDLRIQLWNIFYEDFYQALHTKGIHLAPNVCKLIWKDFLKNPVDKFPVSRSPVKNMSGDYPYNGFDGFINIVKKKFFNDEWYEIFNFIEFVSNNENFKNLNIIFIHNCNLVLAKEVSGYRIINRVVVPITDTNEIQAIETALKTTDKWSSVSTHLNHALEHFSNRENPDYRNSIKESISAVESLAKIVTNDDKAMLSDLIKELKKKSSNS